MCFLCPLFAVCLQEGKLSDMKQMLSILSDLGRTDNKYFKQQVRWGLDKYHNSHKTWSVPVLCQAVSQPCGPPCCKNSCHAAQSPSWGVCCCLVCRFTVH